MKKTCHLIHSAWFSRLLILPILLTSCGHATPAPTPIIVTPHPVSETRDTYRYVNILMNWVQFEGPVSNFGDEGNLQLIMVVSDDEGNAYALLCPYGGVIQVHRGDQVNPCGGAVLSYREDQLKDHLYVMLIAVDVKDKSDFTDIGFNALNASISLGLHSAILAGISIEPGGLPVVIGFLALDTVIGYASNKAQDYFEKNFVIGSQSFALSRQYNWISGSPISARSTNNQVTFMFTTQISTTAGGKIIGATPFFPRPSVQTNSPAPSLLTELDTLVPFPRIFNFQACLNECTGNNSTFTFPEKSKRINLVWQYENIPNNASYVRYQTFGGMEWIKYICVWPHSSSGTESLYFTEPKGLRSGDWVFTVVINDQILLQETLHVQGNWNYWDPAGTLYKCYGTTD